MFFLTFGSFKVASTSEECTDGYAITNNEVRVVLEICGYILWVLAGIYVILVCCLLDRTGPGSIRCSCMEEPAFSSLQDSPSYRSQQGCGNLCQRHAKVKRLQLCGFR